MKVDFTSNKNVKIIDKQKISEMFTNDKEYSTQAYIKRSIVNGKEVFSGIFHSTKKYVKKLSGIADEGEQGEEEKYLYSNNQLKNYNTDREKLPQENELGSMRIYFKFFLLISFFMMISLLLIDIYKYAGVIKHKNEQVKVKYEGKYHANECFKVRITDGPLLNNKCHKYKNMIEKHSNLFFYDVFAGYFGEVYHKLISTIEMNPIRLLITICVLILISLIVKIYQRI
jgi:hypothetical protein